MHTLPTLPFEVSALEPYIDTETMTIHHSKHHQTYIDKLNLALEKYPDLQIKTVEDLLINLNDLPDEIKTAVRNHGGGHFNHSLFWTILRAGQDDNIPSGEIAEAINRHFGSFNNFQTELKEKAVGHFGSGWVFLVVTGDGQLQLVTKTNQDCPLTDGVTPILGLDLWEHAYYLKYQNRRPDYVENFWPIINWTVVDQKYLALK